LFFRVTPAAAPIRLFHLRLRRAGFSHLPKSELLLRERGTAARKITGAPFVVASRDNYDTRRGNARRKSNSGEKKRPGASRA